MKALFLSIIVIFTFSLGGYANTPALVVKDSTALTYSLVEGRWIEEREGEPNNIYVFRKDSSFFKAVDNPELLIFNVSGRYQLEGDSIKIFYQNISNNRVSSIRRIRFMIFHILNRRSDKLEIEKIENHGTSYFTLKKVKF